MLKSCCDEFVMSRCGNAGGAVRVDGSIRDGLTCYPLLTEEIAMPSTGSQNWNDVPNGSTLLLTNTSGPLGIATVDISYAGDDGDPGTEPILSGALSSEPQTIPLSSGGYFINWLIIATSGADGLAGNAGFTATVMNPDGSTNGTPVSASWTKSSGSSDSESGTFNISVV
jgi:hypothetical protein